MTGSEHAVAIVGGGPTGLMLACELRLAGVDVVVLERRATQELDGSRAGGLNARTLEVLDQRGVVERFLEAGRVAQVQLFNLVILDIADLPTRHAYGLALFQGHVERLLAGWAAELDVPIVRSCVVTGLAQDADGVDVETDDGRTFRACFAVGCDGGRSIVRRSAGIAFPGLDASTSWLIAEVEMDDEPPPGMRRDARGAHGLARLGPDGPVRVVLTDAQVETAEVPTMDDLRAGLIAVYGTDYGVHDPRWISRFTDACRQAASYRAGRVLLAGDAAHIHPPQGGQGLNTGVQDAVNLGWKLAQVVQGTSPEGLLDTFHAERHPVGARVLRHTMAQVALARPDERHDALRETMNELLAMDEPRRHLGATLAGIAIAYDLGEGHALLGRRMPDLDLRLATGATRVSELLHDARGVLLVLGGTGAPALDVRRWAGRVRLVEATCDGPWELPLIGAVEAPDAVLIRPDGHVAWAGSPADAGLAEALDRWFGAGPSTSPQG